MNSKLNASELVDWVPLVDPETRRYYGRYRPGRLELSVRRRTVCFDLSDAVKMGKHDHTQRSAAHGHDR
jgi:hypothetical protein